MSEQTPSEFPEEELDLGRVEEPLADEGPGVLSGDAPSRSAELDGEVPDDAFGEALEAWWEAEEPVEGPDLPA